jgi:hypothetical protein
MTTFYIAFYESYLSTLYGYFQRDGEYKVSRGPTLGDFFTICTEASMHYVTVARLQSTRVHTPLSPPLINVMYYVRASLWTVKIFLAQH